jgi:protein-disulfide isomerase
LEPFAVTMLSRFLALTFILFTGISSAHAADVEYGERFIGDENAPVTMIEYASFTCPHCANFHINVLPEIKKNYVDTGKVKVIFRDFPFERVGATAALLARCVEPSRFYGFSDILMKQQENWAHSDKPLDGIFKLAKLAGMSQDKIDACLANEKMLDKIVSVRKDAMDTHGFNSTPSFLINDEKFVGAADYDTFKNMIESKLK